MARPQAPGATGMGQSILIFSGAGLLLWGITHGLIPALHRRTPLEPVVLWFLAGGLGVFVPLAVLGAWLLGRESNASSWTHWKERLRLRPMTSNDWCWTVLGFVGVSILTFAIQQVLGSVHGDLKLQPAFMSLAPLGPGRYWILAAWFPFWIVNILAEEFLWRAVLLPRQEAALGRWAWVANALGWTLFHAAFGWPLLGLLLPILLIVPFIAQRTQSSWPGTLIHAGLNGPGFVAVALGVV
ncbi:MAG: CPBP family intramembrane glutamic endopeptidase [Prosthecobacter sp.]